MRSAVRLPALGLLAWLMLFPACPDTSEDDSSPPPPSPTAPGEPTPTPEETPTPLITPVETPTEGPTPTAAPDCSQARGGDVDGDGVCGDTDNCPELANSSQEDADEDDLGDACDPCPADSLNDIDDDGVCGDADNCPTDANSSQDDADGDGQGDACDLCPADSTDDSDGDGVCDLADNCLSEANAGQEDEDGDGLGDACDACPADSLNDIDDDGVCGDADNCPENANSSQADMDQDGLGNACDACPADSLNDIDDDGVCGDADNCPENANSSQADLDQDDQGDACDACPLDPLDDADDDGICGEVDNCPENANSSQADTDGDGLGNTCDACPADDLNDVDGDSVCGDLDNCPSVPNPTQGDVDGNGVGDACAQEVCDGQDNDGDGQIDEGFDDTDGDGQADCVDRCPLDPANDLDDDGICGDADNCPDTLNPGQGDLDGDGAGDACDVCPGDALDDQDADQVCGNEDNCPETGNPGQADTDLDGTGDACDTETCDGLDNDGNGSPDDGFADTDGDARADCVDSCPLDAANDLDGDGLCGDVDNCPDVANSSQQDLDGDGLGDDCDACALDADNDLDADGVCGEVDNCPVDPNPLQEEVDGDGEGDACDLCPLDVDNDLDQDGVCGEVDNCVETSNPGQGDSDADGEGDACDVEECDGLDNDGDAAIDEDFPDTDLDAQADCVDTDDDGDGVEDGTDSAPLDAFACADTDGDGCDDCAETGTSSPDNDGLDTDADGQCNFGDTDDDADGSLDTADAFPLDPERNVLPSSLIYLPSTTNVFVYSALANKVTLEKDNGSSVYSSAGSPLTPPADGVGSVSLAAGHYRLTGTSDFATFFAAPTVGGDQLTVGVGPDGLERGKTLLVWAEAHLVVQANDAAPGLVKILRWASSAWVDVGSTTLSQPNTAARIPVSGAGIYKVLATSSGVTVHGSLQANAANHFSYLPASNGLEVGQEFHYQPPPFSGLSELYVLTLSPSTQLTLSGAATSSQTVSALGTVVKLAALTADKLYIVKANKPIMTWVETSPGSLPCDGTILDVDMVPSLDGGLEYGKEFLFATTVNPNTCYTSRRPDIDVLSYDENTHLKIELLTGGIFVSQGTQTLKAGQRYRLGTDLNPGTVYRLTTDQPVNVEQSHDTIEYVGNAFSWRWFQAPARGLDDACDPSDLADHCTLGLACVADSSGYSCQEACGNNQIDFGEDCDDGNTVGADGCSVVCRLERSSPVLVRSVSLGVSYSHEGLTVNPHNGELLFQDYVNDVIKRFNSASLTQTGSFSVGVGMDDGEIAYDPLNDNFLVFIDDDASGLGVDTLRSVELDYTTRGTPQELNLVSTTNGTDDTEDPVGLTVHPLTNKVYVRVYADTPALENERCSEGNLGIWEVDRTGKGIKKLITGTQVTSALGIGLGGAVGLDGWPFSEEVVFNGSDKKLYALNPNTGALRLLFNLSSYVNITWGIAITRTGDVATLGSTPTTGDTFFLQTFDVDGDGLFTW